VCHTVTLPFTLKSILRQKKNYGNSNISPCKKCNFQKNPLKETKILQDNITLELISSFNTSQNIIFQKSSFKNRSTIKTSGTAIGPNCWYGGTDTGSSTITRSHLFLEVLPRPFSFCFVWDPPQHVGQENFCPQSMALSKCAHHLQPNHRSIPFGPSIIHYYEGTPKNYTLCLLACLWMTRSFQVTKTKEKGKKPITWKIHWENTIPLYTRSQGQCSTQIKHSYWCKSWNQPPRALWPCIGPKAEKRIPSNLGSQFVVTLGTNVPAFY